MNGRVKTVREIIRDDYDQYQIPESVEATFINIGTNDVEIDQYNLTPGETYRVGVMNFITDPMSVKVNFKGKGASNNKVLLLYAAPINC